MLHKAEPGMNMEGGYVGVPNKTAAVTTGIGVSLAKYNSFALQCRLALLASGGCDATFYIAQGTNSTQYSSVYLATVTLVSSTTADAEDVIEVKASDLTSGYSYVKGVIICASTTTQQAVSAQNLRFNPRFA
jgi:ABC-type branched-subunit amino acid transport system permease subunit